MKEVADKLLLKGHHAGSERFFLTYGPGDLVCFLVFRIWKSL
jgi:hypothetical protein